MVSALPWLAPLEDLCAATAKMSKVRKEPHLAVYSHRQTSTLATILIRFTGTR